MGLIKDKPVKLVKNVQENLPAVRADAIRVRQVLLNLLSNADQVHIKGSTTVDVAVSTNPTGHPEVLVHVTDTGPGIDPKDQAKLFQPFSQVDGSLTRKTGGSGLGLSISQQFDPNAWWTNSDFKARWGKGVHSTSLCQFIATKKKIHRLKMEK